MTEMWMGGTGQRHWLEEQQGFLHMARWEGSSQVALCKHSEILLKWTSVILLVDTKAVKWPEILIHQSSLTVIYMPTVLGICSLGDSEFPASVAQV